MQNQFPSTQFPNTRFQGSKNKLSPWIWGNINKYNFSSVLDAFGGTGVIGYTAKQNQKEVIFNDILRSSYYNGLALIENNYELLNKEEVDYIIRNNKLNNDTFIERTFKNIYYTDEENKWLDMAIANIKEMKSIYKRAIALSALFQSCIIKRPYNLFHRANLYMRFADVKRGFGNKTTWDTSFEVHFKKIVKEYNDAVFNNNKENKAFNYNIFNLPSNNYDLVYIDTPYYSIHRQPTDYYSFYHFLEGLCIYVEKDSKSWYDLIDFNRKPLPLKHDTYLESNMAIWTNQKKIEKGFDDLFKKFQNSILVVSYNEDGFPSKKRIVEILSQYKKNIQIINRNYKYALRSDEVNELLFIAY